MTDKRGYEKRHEHSAKRDLPMSEVLESTQRAHDILPRHKRAAGVVRAKHKRHSKSRDENERDDERNYEDSQGHPPILCSPVVQCN